MALPQAAPQPIPYHPRYGYYIPKDVPIESLTVKSGNADLILPDSAKSARADACYRIVRQLLVRSGLGGKVRVGEKGQGAYGVVFGVYKKDSSSDFDVFKIIDMAKRGMESKDGEVPFVRHLMVNPDVDKLRGSDPDKDTPLLSQLRRKILTSGRIAIKVDYMNPDYNTYARMAVRAEEGGQKRTFIDHFKVNIPHLRTLSENLNHLTFNCHVMKPSDLSDKDEVVKDMPKGVIRGYNFSPVFVAAFSVDLTIGMQPKGEVLDGTFRITLMELLDAVSLGAIDTYKHFNATHFVRAELALLSMYHAGLIHMDLHLNNFLFDAVLGKDDRFEKLKTKVYIIDFGLSIGLLEAGDIRDANVPGATWREDMDKALKGVRSRIKTGYLTGSAGFSDAVYRDHISYIASKISDNRRSKHNNGRHISVISHLKKYLPDPNADLSKARMALIEELMKVNDLKIPPPPKQPPPPPKQSKHDRKKGVLVISDVQYNAKRQGQKPKAKSPTRPMKQQGGAAPPKAKSPTRPMQAKVPQRRSPPVVYLQRFPVAGRGGGPIKQRVKRALQLDFARFFAPLTGLARFLVT
jgi:hypothetical protein